MSAASIAAEVEGGGGGGGGVGGGGGQPVSAQTRAGASPALMRGQLR